jgi:hypothetical protein
LRALLGEVVESLILADRVLFLAEQLRGGAHSIDWNMNESPTNRSESYNERERWHVSALNIFELASGSARNVVLRVEKASATYDM